MWLHVGNCGVFAVCRIYWCNTLWSVNYAISYVSSVKKLNCALLMAELSTHSALNYCFHWYCFCFGRLWFVLVRLEQNNLWIYFPFSLCRHFLFNALFVVAVVVSKLHCGCNCKWISVVCMCVVNQLIPCYVCVNYIYYIYCKAVTNVILLHST